VFPAGGLTLPKSFHDADERERGKQAIKEQQVLDAGKRDWWM